MRSPADYRLRRSGERMARGLALALLALLLFDALRPEPRHRPREVSSQQLAEALRGAVLEGGSAGIVLQAETLPAPTERAWLAALKGAGVPIWWSAAHPVATVLAVEPVADPRGGVEVRFWRSDERPVIIADAAGELARLQPATGESMLRARAVVREVSGILPGQRATAAAGDSLILRDVLVLGRAGWEARFLLRTLEELGWSVSTRLSVAPGVDVLQGSPAAPDTVRYSVIVVLDTSAAAHGAAVARYARSGGGVVLVGEAARITALQALAPGRASRRERGSDDVLHADAPRLGLALHPISQLRDDAVVLQRHGALDAVAARRAGAGRVVQVGYDESWRWRMEGGEEGVDAYREWWSQVLAAAAYAPAGSTTERHRLLDPAPLASTVEVLGVPRLPDAAPPEGPRLPTLSLFLASLALLLGEWTSRRLRGVA